MHRHPDEILKNRTPVARVKLDQDGLRNHEVNHAYFKLWHRYKELGIFEPSQVWNIKVSIVNMLLLAITVYSILNYPENWFFNGMLLGTFFSQSGFMTHDSLHRYTNKDVDDCYNQGWFWSNCCFGVNSYWWQVEHDPHHAAPNTFNGTTGKWYDTQAEEAVWCQTEELLGFFKAFSDPFFIKY